MEKGFSKVQRHWFGPLYSIWEETSSAHLPDPHLSPMPPAQGWTWSPTSQHPWDERRSLSEARQAFGKVTGAGEHQSGAGARKAHTQQSCRQLQSTGDICSTKSV